MAGYLFSLVQFPALFLIFVIEYVSDPEFAV